jgi:DNA-binding CsgD family transcriptional regulator
MKTTNHTAATEFTRIFEVEHPAEINAEYAAEQDEKILMTNLEFAEKLFPESGLGLCPVSHTRMHYLSKNCGQIFGHPHSELMKMAPADIFALVHPDDLTLLQQCYTHIKGLKPFDPAIYRFVIQFRMRNQANEYFVMRNENLAIRVTEKSFIYLMLYNRETEPEKYHRVKLDILKKNGSSFLKIGAYYPKQDDKEMTPRQTDIARLVTKGYTNQEIADQLGISPFTIKNHKKMLFKKVKVRNSVQLANYLKEFSR